MLYLLSGRRFLSLPVHSTSSLIFFFERPSTFLTKFAFDISMIFFKHFDHSLGNFLLFWTLKIELRRVKRNIFFYFKCFFRDINWGQVCRSHMSVYGFNNICCTWQEKINVRKGTLQRSGFKLNPVAVKECVNETARYLPFIMWMKNFWTLLVISIVKEVFLWITSDQNIA